VKDAEEAIENMTQLPKPQRGGQPTNKSFARNKSKQKKFFKVLQETLSLSAAAKATKTAPSTVYALMDRNPEFKALVDEARRESVDVLEGKGYSMAKDGIKKPVIHQGKVTDHYYEDSPSMVQFMLKNLAPERYNAGSAIDVNVSGNIEVSAAKQKLLTLLGVNPDEIVEGEIVED
jgi:hypothetical protein